MRRPLNFGTVGTLSDRVPYLSLSNLTIDIEFKLIYVGSAESEEYDQELDSILVGPVPVGLNKFVFEVSSRLASSSLCLFHPAQLSASFFL